MIKSVATTRSALARPAPQPVRTVGFSAWVLYPPGGAQEGSPFQGFPTWRFRVLKTALRLRPRRALSSASGQKHPFSTMPPGKKSLKFRNLCLTNHIPEIRVTPCYDVLGRFSSHCGFASLCLCVKSFFLVITIYRTTSVRMGFR